MHNHWSSLNLIIYNRPGTAEFQLPASEILGVGREIWTAMAIVAAEAKDQPLGPDLDDDEDVRRDLKRKWD